MALAETQAPNLQRFAFGSPEEALSFTASKIGGVIENSVYFFPMRAWAAKMAAKAERKDYLGQLRELYKGVLGCWSYVRDPLGVELLASTPKMIWEFVLGSGKKGGAGDCDDVAAALGACSRLLGFDCLIRTVAIKSQDLPDHVHIVVVMPNTLLVSMDPVVEPKRDGFGFWPRGFRDWIWSTKGALVWHSDNRMEQEEFIFKNSLQVDNKRKV